MKRCFPKITSVRLGINAHSGGLGFDITLLLIGGTLALASGLVFAAFKKTPRAPPKNPPERP